MPDEDECLVQKRARERDAAPPALFARETEMRDFKRFRQVCHAILEDDEAEHMPSEALGEEGSQANLAKTQTKRTT